MASFSGSHTDNHTAQHEFRHENFENRVGDLQLPPDELLRPLMEVYFRGFNSFHPVVHRGLFEQSLRQDRDKDFVALVLMVCACGARFIPDPSFLPPEPDGKPHGWRFFEQVEPFLRIPTPTTPTLYHMQLFIVRTC